MSSHTYLDTPNANLVCCICRSPFVEPCTARTCFHTFCYECISQAIAINCLCPIDRTPLSLHDLAPADPVIRNLVDELIVQCPQEPLGCSHTCQRLLLPVHIAESCKYVQVNCPNPECAQLVLRGAVESHQCERPVSDVGAQGTQNQDNGESSNPKTEGEARDDAQAAKTSNPTSPPSFTDLVAENTMLRLRLSALENVVHELRSEMYAVKHALGPWYRPDVQPQFHAYRQAEPPLATFEVLDGPISAAAEAQGQDPINLSESPPLTLPEDPSDIASYFPNPEESIWNAQSRPRRSRASTDATRIQHLPAQSPTSPTAPYPTVFPNTPAVGYVPGGLAMMYGSSSYTTPGPVPALSYPQGTAIPTNSPTALSIPPLDPTTPLPDTLASLHSSLGTLAGALGALAAARGSESLRTTEEIRGMRAAMHGLRMQMHDMLTSRTQISGQGPAGRSADADGPGPDTAGPPPHWPRPYGQYPLYPHLYPLAQLGMAHPAPANITKL